MISELFAKYQFGAMYTADITDGKFKNRALYSAESEIFRLLYLPCVNVVKNLRTTASKLQTYVTNIRK